MTPLFDIQVNGFGGVDFQGAPTRAEVRHACEKLHAHGMKRILATFITDTPDALLRKFAAFEAHREADPLIASTIVGYHLEGPYMSSEPGYRGAHSGELMKDPDSREFARWQDAAGGAIRLVTLAPERAGAIDFIAEITQRSVRVSLGHTNADERTIDEAIRAGATLCTHLGNGCPAELPRHDNIIQRLLVRDELIACFIPDGIHLPWFVLRNLIRAKPAGKVLLTTDAMAAAGAPTGRYRLGPHEVEVGPDRVVRLPGAKNLAGSALALDTGVANVAKWLGLPPAAAAELASTIPARAVGFSA
ncbi:MAG: N-acetylglucosamine-6-phosphate deacetylase [Verrucomicrobia bacterium]|nr:N-acetylglucosamine-6-phosphate deacetylase [Verrucomicrobiota bacterium]